MWQPSKENHRKWMSGREIDMRSPISIAELDLAICSWTHTTHATRMLASVQAKRITLLHCRDSFLHCQSSNALIIITHQYNRIHDLIGQNREPAALGLKKGCRPNAINCVVK